MENSEIDLGTGQYRVAGLAGYPAYAHIRYGERGQRDLDEDDYRRRGYLPLFEELEWRARGGGALAMPLVIKKIATG